MKNLLRLMVLGLLVFSTPVMAQDEPASGDAVKELLTRAQKRAEKKAARKEREEAKKAELSKLYKLVENKTFVIDAEFLYDKYSRQYIATNHNFVSIDGDRIVLQTASPAGYGFNGMGGVTIVGKIHDYEIRKDKKGETIFVTAQMTSNYAGSGTVFIRINGKDNASARFYGPWGRGIEFSGNIEIPEKSFRYEGQSVPL